MSLFTHASETKGRFGAHELHWDLLVPNLDPAFALLNRLLNRTGQPGLLPAGLGIKLVRLVKRVGIEVKLAAVLSQLTLAIDL